MSIRTFTYLIYFLIIGHITSYAQSDSTTIAIIGCHDQHKQAPAIPYFANKIKPEFTIWVGDNVYADTRNDAHYIQQQLDVLAQKEGFLELKEISKFRVTWDDHDYGLNNADKSYTLKNESLQIHRKFWALENDVPKEQDGIYHSKMDTLSNGKTIQFIMLDIRFNKEKGDILGENQWEWLEQQLQKKADLRFIVSGTQILLNRPCRWEAWVKQGNSKKRLFQLIESYEAKGVLFITGDQHYVEVLKGKKNIGYQAYEIMAAGINKNEKPGWASKRVAGPDTTIHSAPLMTIIWNNKPHILFTVTNVQNGESTLTYKILFSEIGL